MANQNQNYLHLILCHVVSCCVMLCRTDSCSIVHLSASLQVRERALKEVPMANRDQTYAAIRSLLASLGDPFTRFLDPDQYAALR